MQGFRGDLWLDGVIASLAVAALGAAVVFDEVLKTTGGSTLVIATNLAYPLADVLLLALVVATFALTGWRFDRTWAFVAVGFPCSRSWTAPTSTRPRPGRTEKACSTWAGRWRWR